MVVTVLCAGLTVVFFIISSVNEAQWKFGDEESTVEISSKNTLNKFRNHENITGTKLEATNFCQNNFSQSNNLEFYQL